MGSGVAHMKWVVYRKILMGAKSHITYLIGKTGLYK
jgi:hypothetical protein